MSIPQTFKALYSAPHPGGEFTFKDVPTPTLDKNDVLVKVAFAGITPIDSATVRGFWRGGAAIPGDYKTSFDRPVGFEGSGIVTAVGEDLKYPVKVGDRVYIIGPGNYAQYRVTTSDNLYPIQEGLSLEDAASHYINPTTVHYLVRTVQEGNYKAVIHTVAGSAVGRMLIKALKQKGITSINIVRRNDFIEELKKDGADYVLNSTDEDFLAKLKEIATKENATIGFDAIAGDFSAKVLSAMPPKSSLYLYGGLSGTFVVNSISIGDLFQHKRVGGLSDTNHLFELEEKGETRKGLTEIQSLIPTVYKSHVHKIFKLEEVKEALEYASKNGSKGKVLLQP